MGGRSRGVVGIRIHNLKNQQQLQSFPGGNPFDYLHFIGDPSRLLSSVAKLYDPPYLESKNVYAYIQQNLTDCIEEAIEINDTFTL
jgi:hypothetical protein